MPAGTSSGPRTCRFCGTALIHHPDLLDQTRPDHILIPPWNLRAGITAQLAHTREWGASFVLPIPRLEVF